MATTTKSSVIHPDRTTIMMKIDKATKTVTAASLLATLKKKGAAELTITELRKRLTTLKTPLSKEIIGERKRH